jgi:hypothetical protein
VTGRWFSPSTSVSPYNTIERLNIAEILLKEKFDVNNGPDIAYDKQDTIAVICNIYSLTVSKVYFYIIGK